MSLQCAFDDDCAAFLQRLQAGWPGKGKDFFFAGDMVDLMCLRGLRRTSALPWHVHPLRNRWQSSFKLHGGITDEHTTSLSAIEKNKQTAN